MKLGEVAVASMLFLPRRGGEKFAESMLSILNFDPE
jgi:hypothetical protein